MDSVSPKRKIIQKRLRKKERYARMVRIRQRLHDKVALAQVQPIRNQAPFQGPARVYRLPVGFVVGEKDGRLHSDISNLNQTYKNNCVEVLEDDDKLITVTLNKNNISQQPANYEYIDEWEQRPDPYWKSWAKRLRSFSKEYQDFIQSNKNKFSSDKLDALSIQRYNNYRAKRKEFLNYKSCMEIHKTFNLEGYNATRISYNEKCVSKLHYQFDEFVDKLLKEGIPKIVYSKNSNNGFMFNVMMDNFQSIFEKPLVVPPVEIMFGSKGGELKKVIVHHMVAGYFAKRTAQVSFMVAFDVVEPLPMAINYNPSPMFVAQQITNNYERQDFLEKYYPLKYLEMLSKSTFGTPLQLSSPSHSEDNRQNDNIEIEKAKESASGMKIEEGSNQVKFEVKVEENTTPSLHSYQ